MGRFLAWIKVEPLLAVVLWGAVYPGAKLGLRVIPATSFAALRLLVASAILRHRPSSRADRVARRSGPEGHGHDHPERGSVDLEPVSAVVIAAVLLSESFGLGQALGGALTLVAVWIMSAPGGRDAATSEA